MSGRARFDKKNSTKFALVHRPHDDPNFHDTEASEHVLVPIRNPNAKRELPKPKPKVESSVAPKVNKHAGEAMLYGITFDDSKYDYTQHLKPMGLDPANSIFIPAKGKGVADEKKKKLKNPEDLFVEPSYRDVENSTNDPMFVRGVAKSEYLEQMQNIPEELAGFKPGINPALREVLEALEDEAYVVNDDIVVESKKKSRDVDGDNSEDGDDDIFAELLASGKADGLEKFEEKFDEWDMENLEEYEDEHYKEEMSKFDKIDNLEDLQAIDISADVRRFKLQQKKVGNDWDSDDDFNEDGSVAYGSENLDEEEGDVLADLPTFANASKKGKKSRKSRHKKGAMSDVSGFSMSSSAIARTEVMTILDDKYDQIIEGYENYEEHQEEEEEDYEPFDMSKERPDFEGMLDDFLDNYELGSGGRKLVKKNEEVQRLKNAADEVSKGKLSMRRKREQEKKNSMNGITNSLSSLKF